MKLGRTSIRSNIRLLLNLSGKFATTPWLIFIILGNNASLHEDDRDTDMVGWMSFEFWLMENDILLPKPDPRKSHHRQPKRKCHKITSKKIGRGSWQQLI
jgi:hypothetical protein